MDYNELVEESRSLLAEAEQAISEDNLELAQEKQQEVAAINDKLKVAKTQKDAEEALEELQGVYSYISIKMDGQSATFSYHDQQQTGQNGTSRTASTASSFSLRIISGVLWPSRTLGWRM